MVESAKLNTLLAQNLDRLISELLPDGKQHGHEYVCASCFGGRGTSFSLNTNKAIWKDFADDTKGGDLISLFIARAGGDKRAGMAAVYQFLGLKQSEAPKVYIRPAKKYSEPKPDWHELDGPVFSYLTKDRGLSEDILGKYGVMMNQDRIGPAYVFIYKSQSDNVTFLAKYVALARRDGKKVIVAQADGLHVLYGMHTVPYGTERVIITAGEIDAITYGMAGYPAVSIPNGDKNLAWIDNSWDFLSQFKTIYLSFDMDESGDSMVDVVAARLGVERCRKISLPYKDGNETYLNNEDLTEYVEQAKDITPIGFIHSSDLMEGVWEEISKGPRNKQGIPFLGWDDEESVGFRIRPHEITAYLGMEFSGKSTLLYQLAAYLAGVHGQSVAIASLEENPEAVLSVMLTQWLATSVSPEAGATKEDFEELYRQTIGRRIFIYNDRTAEAPIKNLLDFAEYCVKRYGCKHVIIDSATCTDLDVENLEEANTFMKTLVRYCNSTQAHFHIVHHARKGNADENDRASMPKRRDLKGSISIPALSTNILVVWRNGLKQSILDNKRQTKYNPEDVKLWEDAVLAVRKDKVGGKAGEYPLFFNPETYRFRRNREKKDAPYIVEHPF